MRKVAVHAATKPHTKAGVWSVYVLLCIDGSLYTGCSPDVEKRFLAHLHGRGGRYTRSHKPVRIVFQQQIGSLSAALKREHQIKSWPRQKKIEKLGISAEGRPFLE